METKLRENIGKKELSDSLSVNVFCARGINYPLHKAMVYHDHNQIISVGIGQSSDEIHQYGREWEACFNSQRGKSGHCGMSVYLGHLAVSTSQDELSEEGRHSRPTIVPLHLMKSSEEPFMSPGSGPATVEG